MQKRELSRFGNGLFLLNEKVHDTCNTNTAIGLELMATLAQIILSRLDTLGVCQGTGNANGHDIFLEACLLMSNMLFLPRSQPIHRQLLSGLLQIDGHKQQQIVIQSITEQVYLHDLLLPVSLIDAASGPCTLITTVDLNPTLSLAAPLSLISQHNFTLIEVEADCVSC